MRDTVWAGLILVACALLYQIPTWRKAYWERKNKRDRARVARLLEEIRRNNEGNR